MLYTKRTESSHRGASLIWLLAAAAFASGEVHSQTTVRLAPQACGALKGYAIPASAIGLPSRGAVVEEAVVVHDQDNNNPNGDFCKITGSVMPRNPKSYRLQFEANLPLLWNGRAVQFGGGGYDGWLQTALGAFPMQPANTANALKQGYITLGSDGGHQGGAGFDGKFGMDEEALLNYGQQSIKKTHDVVVAIISKAYGRLATRFYFIGGSQGGHEALDAAARYPMDYDGVVANFPAYNITLLHLGSLELGKALYENGGAGWLSAAKTKLITDAVYAACDRLDGATDGIISNVAACQKNFDVTSLRCPSGTDRDDKCLSDAQIKAVNRISSEYRPGFAVAGMEAFPKWSLLEGALFEGVSNFGQVQQPSNPLSGKEALLYMAGDQTAKFIITRQPSLDAMAFDPGKWRSRITKVASIMDVTDVSLAKFRAKGGKVILTHGTTDDLITPYNTVSYYQRQLSEFGQAGVNDFMRFYLIPGYGHGFGKFDARFNSLQVLQTWVEDGRAPANLTAEDGNQNAHRARPLCEWPTWPRFTGAPGTENEASSFTCTYGDAQGKASQ